MITCGDTGLGLRLNGEDCGGAIGGDELLRGARGAAQVHDDRIEVLDDIRGGIDEIALVRGDEIVDVVQPLLLRDTVVPTRADGEKPLVVVRSPCRVITVQLHNPVVRDIKEVKRFRRKCDKMLVHLRERAVAVKMRRDAILPRDEQCLALRGVRQVRGQRVHHDDKFVLRNEVHVHRRARAGNVIEIEVGHDELSLFIWDELLELCD